MADVLAVAFDGYPIRVTDKIPKEAALIDVLGAMGYAHPKDALHDLREKYPELVGSLPTNSFGRRGRPTPVVDEQTLIKILLVLEGPKAAVFREWASSILIRYLKGDRTLAAEIHLRADLLGEDIDDENSGPLPPPPSLSPLDIAVRIESQALSLFWEKDWNTASSLLQVALRYRALLSEAPSGTHRTDSDPEELFSPVEETNFDSTGGSDSVLRRRTGAIEGRRPSLPRGQAAPPPVEATWYPPEPKLTSRASLFLGWEEISKGAALSVWEALGRYQTSPWRYPKFFRALSHLFGIKNPREALRCGEELERELLERNGEICQKLQLSRTRGKIPERNSPRFRTIQL